jgi:GNAT superfamily N-acetyltransferase
VLQSRHRHPDRTDRPVIAADRDQGGRLSIAIRLASEADLPALAALRRQWTAELDGHVDDRAFADAFADWWVDERERRTIWLAEGGTPVGMVNLVEFRRMPRPGRPPSAWGYLGNVYVQPAHRNRGVGGALLGAAVAEARRRGYERVVLNPSEPSVSLYLRAGFAPANGLLLLDLLELQREAAQ